MNKKAEESGTSEVGLDIGRLLLTALVVLTLIYIGVQIWNISYGKDAQIKKSFTSLVDEIDTVTNSGSNSSVAVYLTNNYDVVLFNDTSLSSGRYEKPTECGLDSCLVVCKQGLISLKDNCKKPLIYKDYGHQKFIYDSNNPVVLHGINGILMTNVNLSTNNFLEISPNK